MSQISPCNKVCRLEHGICVSCFRTAPEISMWPMISDTAARALMAELPKRQRRLNSDFEEIVE
ncbi:MAG: DUF1289 domain-containing protein [Ilumatobacteraceae bacterium]|jgi:predicted Fe-S protein YdhL (DUF1289 family)|nr:DUF1289 domain-containing protein [Actinomycetota bacterium]